MEMIIQTLSAVECLLIKCRSDPNFMSPTFLKPNFGATLVVKEILESEILICDFVFNDMSLCSYIVFRSLDVVLIDLLREYTCSSFELWILFNFSFEFKFVNLF